jgi:hypothetical protein
MKHFLLFTCRGFEYLLMAEGVSLSYIPVVKIFSLVSIQKNMSIGRLYINHLCLVGAPLHPCINGCSIPRI